MKTAPVILSIAAGGSLSVHLIPRVREIVMNSDLGNLVVGEGAQCSLGHGLDGLFRKTAEEVLATKPDWPETGFRGVVRDQLDKAHNPIMAYLDYEPYGDDEATRKYRFDAGNRPRTNAEMDLVIRCIGQIQSESYERGIKLEVGVWNTPITIDKSVDWPSPRFHFPQRVQTPSFGDAEKNNRPRCPHYSQEHETTYHSDGSCQWRARFHS